MKIEHGSTERVVVVNETFWHHPRHSQRGKQGLPLDVGVITALEISYRATKGFVCMHIYIYMDGSPTTQIEVRGCSITYVGRIAIRPQ